MLIALPWHTISVLWKISAVVNFISFCKYCRHCGVWQVECILFIIVIAILLQILLTGTC